MKSANVFIGLSGGVDSAVSAALLKQQGYDVTGVFITIALPGYPCPAATDRIEAMRVAAHLDIPFIDVDLSKEYEARVFKPSVAEWGHGHTPNPDTLCNEKIKFGVFFDFCIAHGADYVATGHYAELHRPRKDSQSVELRVAADLNKDQTYFLWAVPEEKLQKTLFPIGHLQKSEVRALAATFGLPNASRKDSQGLCFLGPVSLDDMIENELPQTPGVVLDEQGTKVGTHRGAAHYTLGQRHGFDLMADTPHTAPHFVIAKDMKANTITVSTTRTPSEYRTTRLVLKHCNWIGAIQTGEYDARFRYRQTLIPAMLIPDTQEVVLHKPYYVPLGQSLVLYKGSRCIGGGIVENATLE